MPPTKHNARRAAEAHAWRLALLLTGAEDLAAEVAIQVRRAQPRLEALESRRLNRLVVMRSREVVQSAARRRASRASSATAPDAAAQAEQADPAARPILRALAAMEEQPREAWIFARLDALGDIEVARSMDCSKTATARFLTEADAAIVRDLGSERSAFPPDGATDRSAPAPQAPDESPEVEPTTRVAPLDLTPHLQALRHWLDTLSPDESIEARRAIHRRRRRLWLGAWLLIAATIITAAVLLLAWL
jgi:DNA-directed RNA polymerase specialized sigma24 family protein